MRLADTAFVVTDTETTGMRAGTDRLIEIAAVRMEGGCITARFQRLINPECHIPGRIARLTGITTAMVFDQPCVEEVIPDYLDFLNTGVFVAHNLSFDLRFVNAALRECGLDELSAPTLCTLRLARRLLPGLRSKSLASVCQFYQIQNARAHRALGDAEATAGILGRFLNVMEQEHQVTSLPELLTFQHRSYRSAARSSHLATIRKGALSKLPVEPGVYFMKDAAGKTIYIGKARNLRARVMSYFTAIEGHPPRLRKMVEVVRDVDWQITDSELDALLLESRLIKDQQPRFNRAQRQYHARPFLRLDVGDGFPRLGITPVLHNDGARYFGPLDNRETAERITEVIDRFFLLRSCTDDEFAGGEPCERARQGRCGAPCAGYVTADAYAEEVRRVEAFLNGETVDVLESLRAAMRRAAVAMAYEEAASLRNSLQCIEQLLDRDGCVAPSVLDQNGVLAHVNADGDAAGTLRLHLIRYGRLQESLKLPARLSSRDRAELKRCLHMYFHPEVEQPDRYYVEEVDEVRLIRQWAYTNRSRIERVPWEHSMDADALLEGVHAAVDRLTT